MVTQTPRVVGATLEGERLSPVPGAQLALPGAGRLMEVFSPHHAGMCSASSLVQVM